MGMSILQPSKMVTCQQHVKAMMLMILLTNNFKKRFAIVVSYSKTNKFIQLLSTQPKLQNQ